MRRDNHVRIRFRYTSSKFIRYRACFEQGVPWHLGNYRVWIPSKTRTWYDNSIQFKVSICMFFFTQDTSVYYSLFFSFSSKKYIEWIKRLRVNRHMEKLTPVSLFDARVTWKTVSEISFSMLQSLINRSTTYFILVSISVHCRENNPIKISNIDHWTFFVQCFTQSNRKSHQRCSIEKRCS